MPAVLAIAFRYWPQTPMGKRVLLEVPTEEEVLPDTPQLRALRKLVGKVGVAKSMMLPSGAISVEGPHGRRGERREADRTGSARAGDRSPRQPRGGPPGNEEPTAVESAKRKSTIFSANRSSRLGLEDDPLA